MHQHFVRIRTFLAMAAIAALGLSLISHSPAQAAAGCTTTSPALGVTVSCTQVGSETITVPSGATRAIVTVIGGGGGSGRSETTLRNSGAGGDAAMVSATITIVAPTVAINVAGGGAAGSGSTYSASGGGFSAVRQLINSTLTPMVIAGGGGGGAGGLSGAGGPGGAGGHGAANATPAGGSGFVGPPTGNFAGGNGGSDGVGGASAGVNSSNAGSSWAAGGGGGALISYAPSGGAGYGGGASGQSSLSAPAGASGAGAGGSYADPTYTSAVTYARAIRGGDSPHYGAGGLSVNNVNGQAGFLGKVEITFLDSTDTVVVGMQPWGVAITPDGTKAYIGNSGSSSISVLDLNTNTVDDTIVTTTGSAGVVIDDTGALAYVGNFAFTGPGNISTIGLSNNSVLDVKTATCAFAGPLQMSPTMMGTSILYSCANEIRIMDTTTMGSYQVVAGAEYGDVVALNGVESFIFADTFNQRVARATFTGGVWTFPWSLGTFGIPYSIALAPDGLTGVAGSLITGKVTFFDVATGIENGDLLVSGGGDLTSIAYDPTGATIYITDKRADRVVVVDVASRTELGTIPVGAGPQRIAITPNGTKAVVTNNNANTVSVLALDLEPALTPAFDTVTRQPDGYTVQVSNFDANYVWTVSATAGASTISDTGLVTVTGLPPASSSIITVTAARFSYATGSATEFGDALQPARDPDFGTPVSTANGFTVQVTNYVPHIFTWSASASPGAATIDGTGFVTVTGLAPGESVFAQVAVTAPGYVDGLGFVIGVADTAVPQPPTAVTGSPGDESINLDWAAPILNGGSVITGYQVQHATDPNGTYINAAGGCADAPTSPATSCEITGLANAATYYVKVQAINAVGPGDYSAVSAGITPTATPVPPTPPGPRPTPPAPPTPAPVPLPQQLGAGESLLMVNGAIWPMQVQANEYANGLLIREIGWQAELEGSGPQGTLLPLGRNSALQLQLNRTVVVSGGGFAPGTSLDVYLNPPVQSTTTVISQDTGVQALGTVVIDAQGEFVVNLPLSTDITPGDHILQTVGVSPSMQIRAMNFGVIIDASVFLSAAPRTSAGKLDRITALGSTAGLPEGTQLTPHVRFKPRSDFKAGKSVITVRADGTFTWSRLLRKNRYIRAYVSYQDVNSGVVTWLRVR